MAELTAIASRRHRSAPPGGGESPTRSGALQAGGHPAVAQRVDHLGDPRIPADLGSAKGRKGSGVRDRTGGGRDIGGRAWGCGGTADANAVPNGDKFAFFGRLHPARAGCLLRPFSRVLLLGRGRVPWPAEAPDRSDQSLDELHEGHRPAAYCSCVALGRRDLGAGSAAPISPAETSPCHEVQPGEGALPEGIAAHGLPALSGRWP